MAKDLSVVGKRVPLIDARARAAGAAKYTTDIQLEGMLYGKIVKSPYAHARIVSIDTSKAEALPGVRLTLTYMDVPKIRYVSNPQTIGIEDMYVLEDEVRCVGDEVALVVAESEDLAREAIKLVDINYEVLPAVFDPEDAIKPESPKVHTGCESNIVSATDEEWGDIEKGFAEADIIQEDTIKVQRVSPVPLEPHACVAAWDKSGNLTVWETTQIPFGSRQWLSKVLDIPLNKIRIIAKYVGGAFGSKNDVSRYLFLAALASRKAHKPVKIVYSKEDEFLLSPTRHPMVFDMKIGARNDGAITAMQIKALVDTGNIASVGPAQTAVLPFLGIAPHYARPNFKYEGYCVYTNYINSGSCRGWGAPEISFAIESVLSTIAEKLNIDPIEFRRRNIIADPGGLASISLQECVAKGAEKIGWYDKWQGYTTPVEVNRLKKRGIGMGLTKHDYGLGLSSAIVKINKDGSVHFLTGTLDPGTGSNTSQAQIVAEELKVAPENVFITNADTETTPYDLGSYGSRTICVGGTVARAAAADAKHKLFELAAQTLDVTSNVLDIGEGRVFISTEPEKGVSIAELAGKSVIIGEAHDIVRPEKSALQSLGAQFAEVEVDTETGQTEVLKIVSVHDVGKAINPECVEGQIVGCIKQGIGYALSEEFIRDPNTGATLNPSYLDYEVYSWLDMPEIDCVIVETADPNRSTPYGCRGAGEPPLTAPHTAIINAIHNAIGIRFKELPVTPDKVLQALAEAQETE
jgi:xanthine dehydrogenase molybdenum-binding subunit